MVVCIYMLFNVLVWCVCMTVIPRIYKVDGWWKHFVDSNQKNLFRWAYSITAIALCGWYLASECARGLYELKKLENLDIDLNF